MFRNIHSIVSVTLGRIVHIKFSRDCTLVLVALSLLSGCASKGGLNSSHAVDSTPAVEITRILDDAAAKPQPSVVDADEGASQEIPDEVTQGLLPDVYEDTKEQERFDLSVENSSAQRFFLDLVNGTEYNVIVHPQVTSTISVELNQVTIPEAIALTAENYQLNVEQRGNLFRILPGGIQTRVFQINYLNVERSGGSTTSVSSGRLQDSGSSGDSGTAEGSSTLPSSSGTSIVTRNNMNFWSSISEMLNALVGSGEGKRVVVNPYAGLIVVRASRDELSMVEDLLKRADLIMQRQVILEAKILEVTLSDAYDQGIEWNAITQLGNGKDSSGNYQSTLTGTLGSSLSSQRLANAVGGVFSAAIKINDFSSVINLLGQQGNVQVLSSPRIATVNNQKAVIKVGTDEFFVTDIDINNNSSSGSSGNQQEADVELTPFFSGISLDVTPQISEDGQIILHIHPAISQVEDQQKVISLGSESLTLPLALNTIRETDSVISAKNQQIVVIGGLTQDLNSESNSGTPILQDIPIIGEAFKQKSQKGKKTELVILLKPVVVESGTNRESIQRSANRTRTLKELLEQPPKATLW